MSTITEWAENANVVEGETRVIFIGRVSDDKENFYAPEMRECEGKEHRVIQIWTNHRTPCVKCECIRHTGQPKDGFTEHWFYLFYDLIVL